MAYFYFSKNHKPWDLRKAGGFLPNDKLFKSLRKSGSKPISWIPVPGHYLGGDISNLHYSKRNGK
jgi:hypothetical protein